MNEQKLHGVQLIKLLLAFAAVYIIWGSTYLAIHYVVLELPPLLLAGVRFIFAGSLLYGWMMLKGRPAPTVKQWKLSAIIGFALFLGGNGLVVVAIQFMPSGITALLVSAVPIWMTLITMFLPGGESPRLIVVLGLIVGILGITILADPFATLSPQSLNIWGVLILLSASFSWAAGSVFASRADTPKSTAVFSAMAMMCGGFFLALAGLITGELSTLNFALVTWKGLASITYLVIFGSLIAFSAYGYLVKNTTPTLLGTYAYVNPVVALFLGAVVAGEVLTVKDIVAAAVILFGVFLITMGKKKPIPAKENVAESINAGEQIVAWKGK